MCPRIRLWAAPDGGGSLTTTSTGNGLLRMPTGATAWRPNSREAEVRGPGGRRRHTDEEVFVGAPAVQQDAEEGAVAVEAVEWATGLLGPGGWGGGSEGWGDPRGPPRSRLSQKVGADPFWPRGEGKKVHFQKTHTSCQSAQASLGGRGSWSLVLWGTGALHAHPSAGVGVGPGACRPN